jgi:hypothetical protein
MNLIKIAFLIEINKNIATKMKGNIEFNPYLNE